MIYANLHELNDKLDWEGDLYLLEEVLPVDIPNVRVAIALERAQGAYQALQDVLRDETQKEVEQGVLRDELREEEAEPGAVRDDGDKESTEIPPPDYGWGIGV